MEITKMTPVKEFLKSARKYDCAAENAYQEYVSLRSDILRITPHYDGAPVKTGTNGADLANGVARLEAASENVISCYDRYAEHRGRISELISQMGEWPDEMRCLQLRYLSYRENKNWRLLNWDVIAEKMYISRRQATIIHGKALRHFAELMDE